MKICNKCKKDDNYTGSGVCSRKIITCGMLVCEQVCRLCKYNLHCKHKKRGVL